MSDWHLLGYTDSLGIANSYFYLTDGYADKLRFTAQDSSYIVLVAPGSSPDMPLEDFLRAFDTIPKNEIHRPFTVVLTGGEPLLRPDIEEVGRAIRQRGAGWSMVSNGWFYDESMHRRLMGAGMGALTISLDGLEAEHDWMRGREGCYQRTSDGTICACPNIDRQVFGQGNIYRDNLWEVWNNKFEAFRDRSWARRGMCKECRKFRDCLGNGMHNWHGDCHEVINCHYRKTL